MVNISIHGMPIYNNIKSCCFRLEAKSRYFTYVIIILCLLFTTATNATTGQITVISPPDKSFVESSAINLIVRSDKNTFDDLQVSNIENKKYVSKKPRGTSLACFGEIKLSIGMNILKIVGFKDHKKVAEMEYRIFYRSSLSPTARSAPSEYTRYFFHTNDHEKKCRSCHQLDFNKTEDNPLSPRKSPCFICHNKMLANYKFVHGPTAVWSCSVCHAARSKSPKLGITKHDEICVTCHENDWQTMKYIHGPTAAGSCTTCHNPHAADERYFLRAKTLVLCSSCHEEPASIPHVALSFSGSGGHPVSMSPDPFNPGQDLTCTSCHNPHATNFSTLLRNDRSLLCQSCHRM